MSRETPAGAGIAESSAADRSVLAHAGRSLFDAIRPSRIALVAERLPGPGGMAQAALEHTDVVGGRGRPTDTVVQAGLGFGPAAEGWIVVEHAPRALGVAYGRASARRRRTVGARTWCLLPADAAVHGDTLEMAQALTTLPPVALLPVVVGEEARAERAAALLEACGLAVRRADDEDPWSVLAAVDHAIHALDRGPVAVVAAHHGEAGPGQRRRESG